MICAFPRIRGLNEPLFEVVTSLQFISHGSTARVLDRPSFLISIFVTICILIYRQINVRVYLYIHNMKVMEIDHHYQHRNSRIEILLMYMWMNSTQSKCIPKLRPTIHCQLPPEKWHCAGEE